MLFIRGMDPWIHFSLKRLRNIAHKSIVKNLSVAASKKSLIQLEQNLIHILLVLTLPLRQCLLRVRVAPQNGGC